MLHCLAAAATENHAAGAIVEGGRIVVWHDQAKAPLPCPSCGARPLVPIGKLDAVVGDGRWQAERGYDVPEVWTMMFTCPGPQGDCDPVVVVGEASLDGDPFPDLDEGIGQMTVVLKPRFISPGLSLLGRVGPHVDVRIVDLGRDAGSVLWIDPDAAANKLRAACELLLDIVGVPTTKSNGDFFTLAARARHAASNQLIDADVKSLLDGLRWLGNAGSHGSTRVGLTDAIEGGRVLNLALRLQFADPDDDRARAAAAAWLAAKGP